MDILNIDNDQVMSNKFWPEGVNCKMWKDKNKISIRSRSYSNSRYQQNRKRGHFNRF